MDETELNELPSLVRTGTSINMLLKVVEQLTCCRRITSLITSPASGAVFLHTQTEKHIVVLWKIQLFFFLITFEV